MKEQTAKGYAFGTFQGVFTSRILTIIGVVMYLRRIVLSVVLPPKFPKLPT